MSTLMRFLNYYITSPCLDLRSIQVNFVLVCQKGWIKFNSTHREKLTLVTEFIEVKS